VKLSSYTRARLEMSEGPLNKEVLKYIKYLESELKKYKEQQR